MDNSIKEQLSYIQTVISDSRHAVANFGGGYVVWGMVIGTASLLHYLYDLGVQNEFFHPGNIWGFANLTGILLTIFFYRKKWKKRRVMSFGEKINIRIWMITFIAIFFTGLAPDLDAFNRYAMVAILVGCAIYLNGFIANLKFLQALGFAWLLSSALMFYSGKSSSMLINAFMNYVGFALPGIIILTKKNTYLKNE